MLRPLVDMAMTVLLLLSMAYEMVSPAFEEFCGRVFGLSFDGYEMGGIIHEWIGTALILLFFWHLWLNRYWLKNLFKGQYNATRTALASYWGYAVMSFHIGLYWHVMSAMMFRRAYLASGVLPHAAAVVLMAYGTYAFVKRQLGEYMFLSSEFVFFDFDEPILYFFIDYIAIMLLFACLGHYLILLFRRLKV